MIEEKEKWILVTRPQLQAVEFVNLLSSHGFNVLQFPTLEIKSVELDESLTHKLTLLNDFDIIIFISSNAVKQTIKQLKILNIPVSSVATKIAVIGQATSDVARQAGFEVTIETESGFNSEALLEHKALQVDQLKNKKILIIRGDVGREKLADVLRQRGANVNYAAVYKRAVPEQDSGVSRKHLSFNWFEKNINVITISSNEGLQNLYDMLDFPGKQDMLNVTIIVPSERSYKLAKSLGFVSIVNAKSACNQDMLIAAQTKLNN